MSYIGQSPTTAAFVTDTFSGNGSTTAFTMSVAPATTSSMLVAVSGVVQDPSTYSIAGTTLTFSAAPPSGTGNVSVRYLGIPAAGVATTAYRTVTEFTATSGQTTFSTPSYTVGFIDVYRNGVRLGSGDFTATSGTSVVLASGATAGDLITTESFYVSSVLNAIPNTAGSVGQSNLAAGVAGNGPAFSALLSANQSITTSVATKLNFDTEEFDTNSNFNTSNYRFTPTVGGYYLITLSVYPQSATSSAQAQIYKNGSLAKRQYIDVANGAIECTALIYMNGSTDYVEGYGYLAGTSPIVSNSNNLTFFQGVLVRSV